MSRNYLRARAVVFVRVRGPYSQFTGEAWEKMFAWLVERGFRDAVSVGYGLAHDDPRSTLADDCLYDACVELSIEALSVVGGEMRSQQLPGGSFVRSRVKGNYGNISGMISTMRDTWIPNQGLKIDQGRPPICIYLSDLRFVPDEERKADTCLPVKPN